MRKLKKKKYRKLEKNKNAKLLKFGELGIRLVHFMICRQDFAQSFTVIERGLKMRWDFINPRREKISYISDCLKSVPEGFRGRCGACCRLRRWPCGPATRRLRKPRSAVQPSSRLLEIKDYCRFIDFFGGLLAFFFFFLICTNFYRFALLVWGRPAPVSSCCCR